MDPSSYNLSPGMQKRILLEKLRKQRAQQESLPVQPVEAAQAHRSSARCRPCAFLNDDGCYSEEANPPVSRDQAQAAAIAAATEHYLEVGDGISLWYRVWGNPEGIPVLFVHGGPGGCAASLSPS